MQGADDPIQRYLTRLLVAQALVFGCALGKAVSQANF